MPDTRRTNTTKAARPLRGLLIACLLALCFIPAPALGEIHGVLRLSAVQGSLNTHIAEAILRAAYADLGIALITVPASGVRALADASSGATDGDLLRIAAIGETHPALLRVEPHLIIFQGTAFAKDDSIRIRSAQDLKGYRVGILQGIAFARKILDDAQASYSETVTNERLFTLLDKGRLDVVITSLNNGLAQINRLGLDGIRPAGPPLVQMKLYHYLHQKHAALVPKVGNTLKRMHESGRIDAIIRDLVDSGLPLDAQ